MEGERVDDSQGESDTIGSNRTIPLILDGKFFKIVHRDKENVQAECTQWKRKIRGRIGATTNFLNHLKIKGHPAKEFADYKVDKAKNPHKRQRESDCNGQQASTSKTQKQSTLNRAFSRTSQQSADALITSFVVGTMSPLSIVEHPAFKKLIDGISKLQHPVVVTTRKTLRTKVDEMFSKMLDYLLEHLRLTAFVCTTADIWSTSKRSVERKTMIEHLFKYTRQRLLVRLMRYTGCPVPSVENKRGLVNAKPRPVSQSTTREISRIEIQ